MTIETKNSESKNETCWAIEAWYNDVWSIGLKCYGDCNFFAYSHQVTFLDQDIGKFECDT